MPDALIGAPVRRKEDRRFITGAGHFTDDFKPHGLAHGCVLRSPHAAARLRSIDTAAAERMPGVLCVLTGRDAAADGLGGLPCGWQTFNRDGSKMAEPPHPVLALERVRHVGDPVAFVVAETVAQAEEAAAAIDVGYDALPSVTVLPRALDAGAPQVWDEVRGNLCYDWEVGDEAGVKAVFATAHRVVSLDLVQNRINACPMEPRACIGQYDSGTESYLLHTSSQNPHIIRVLLAAFTLKVPEERVRVISPDVGGGFGMKIYHYAEEVLVTWASRRCGRPVKWTATRSESFQSDTYARDHATTVKLALDAEGHFIALRVDTIANMGAYLSTFAPAIPTFFYANPLPGPYLTKAVYARVRAAFTNTVPVDAYRGAGRPEATFLLERIVDLAARESGIDPVEIRRRNLIPADAFPYQSPLLWEYDTGDFLRCLDAAMAAADRDGFAARKAESGRKGLLRGQGIAFYMEACGMGPSKMLGQHGCRAGQYEVATVRVNPTGGVTVLTGSHTHGQGHETVFAQIVADRLGLPLEKIDIVHGDTGRVPYGLGSYGSRSLSVGGSALHVAIEKVTAKAKRIAAHLLEAHEADIELDAGTFRVAGTDRGVTFAEIARAAYNPFDYPLERMEPGLEETSFFDPVNFTFPYGCHVLEVEVDPQTGVARVDRYTAIDDFGRQINPMIVAGQMHGGIAQGFGQAALEACRHDPETGQILTGSFMDYALPRARDLPPITLGSLETPCLTNPLGVKGCGEAGAIAAPVAFINGVCDALAEAGVRHIDMPATPEAIWHALQQAATA